MEKSLTFILLKDKFFYNLVRFFSGEEYFHVIVALDPECSSLFSFRKTVTREDLTRYRSSLECLVLEFEIDAEKHAALAEFIRDQYEHRGEFGYNYLGSFLTMITCAPLFRIGFFPLKLAGRLLTRPPRFICSTWLAWVLHRCGINPFAGGFNPKIPPTADYRVTMAYDFSKANLPVRYRGTIGEFVKENRICTQS
ncbi:MAG: hypothetical protein ACM3QZ_08145 [Solirubrobacterales bacterium]